jgi:4-hydroxythreonine-4-phosphate dehydrogenase
MGMRKTTCQTRKTFPRLAVSLGDPAGIGPEVIVKALSDSRVQARVRALVIGSTRAVERALKVCNSSLTLTAVEPGMSIWDLPRRTLAVYDVFPLKRIIPGQWNAQTGHASVASVCQGVEWVLRGQADALVTGPICKEAWHAAGVNAPGHTELLASLTGRKNYAMMFVGGPFKLVLATIHIPLGKVSERLTTEAIFASAKLAVKELQDRFGIQKPRVAVAGLNPHAGEGGLFGDEEARCIEPAIKKIRRLQVARVDGPLAPDTLFVEAAQGRWDLVVSMYHDQGLIPFKMLAMHSGVNITAGLPLIRTSPDHGTAFDLAGTGQANAGSMIAALLTAADMVRHARRKTGLPRAGARRTDRVSG